MTPDALFEQTRRNKIDTVIGSATGREIITNLVTWGQKPTSIQVLSRPNNTFVSQSLISVAQGDDAIYYRSAQTNFPTRQTLVQAGRISTSYPHVETITKVALKVMGAPSRSADILIQTAGRDIFAAHYKDPHANRVSFAILLSPATRPGKRQSHIFLLSERAPHQGIFDENPPDSKIHFLSSPTATPFSDHNIDLERSRASELREGVPISVDRNRLRQSTLIRVPGPRPPRLLEITAGFQNRDLEPSFGSSGDLTNKNIRLTISPKGDHLLLGGKHFVQAEFPPEFASNKTVQSLVQELTDPNDPVWVGTVKDFRIKISLPELGI